MLANTSTRYGSIARSFHWIIAILVLIDLILGLVGKYTPRSADTADTLRWLYSVHKTIGVAVLLLAILRIIWAIVQERPAPIEPENRLQTFVAETVHWALYGAILILPTTGWITHSAEPGFARILWPFAQSLPFVPHSEPLARAAGYLHQVAGYALIGLVVLHVAGALKHALIDRDDTLARMVSGKETGNPYHVNDWPLLPAGAALLFWVFALGFASFGPFGEPAAREASAPIARPAADTGWQVETGTLEIIVRQMGSEVTGHFEDWTASIDYDPDLGTGTVEALIDTGSINIGSVTDQVKGPEFFSVGDYPTAKFEGTISRQEGQTHIAEGPLTLKGQTVPVTVRLDLVVAGDLATMTGEAELDRRDFNMGTEYTDEATVGFPVMVQIDLTARRLPQ